MAYYRRPLLTDFEVFLMSRKNLWVVCGPGVWLVTATVHIISVCHMPKAGADVDWGTYFWRDESDRLEELFDGQGWNLPLAYELVQHCVNLKES